MITTIILLLTVLIFFLPESTVLKGYSRLSLVLKRETLVMRGERLVNWMGLYSPNSVGFNLHCELPEKSIYKGYGHELHYLWEQVRVCGGGLTQPLKSLRALLRRDIKFEKSKKAALYGAWVQIAIMLLLSWSYLAAFIYLEITPVNWNLVGGIISWQALGAVGYVILIAQLEKKYFAASRYFLRFVTKLTVVMNSNGALSQIESPVYLGTLGRDESVVYGKIENVVIRAREIGELNQQAIQEIEDEYWFCLEQKIESFLSLLKKTSFTWSIVFILPSLFVTTMFSFAEIMANNP